MWFVRAASDVVVTHCCAHHIVVAIALSPSFHQSSIPCRNIALYGYCKFAGTTCAFNHDVGPPTAAAPAAARMPAAPSMPGHAFWSSSTHSGGPSGVPAGVALARPPLPVSAATSAAMAGAPALPGISASAQAFVPSGSRAPSSFGRSSKPISADVAPFIPGGGGSGGGGSNSGGGGGSTVATHVSASGSAASSMASGLPVISATTPSFVPASQRATSAPVAAPAPAADATEAPPAVEGESVPVFRNGTMYFVPKVGDCPRAHCRRGYLGPIFVLIVCLCGWHLHGYA